MINWQDLHHAELTVAQLYALLQLRSEVFVVEQKCPYLDVDGEDLVGENRHILGWRNGELAAYARILPREDDGPLAIGRVIVSRALRGEALGQQLMRQTLAVCQRRWPGRAIYLSAQAHLQDFYARFGFRAVTDVYDEDGIPHVGMAREGEQA
ncbi:GNAT family N-acetyltransferase [Intestinirhabdus alba]|jgi:ElaA protein|uniref:Protein ElaA n=1 Tax=Intestinirhabdus alba TaxID=2899544 RepID=A0A6L6IN14_9ENTR|nr:GNAT family N-acetyltransferase [Intestinirhabdus alba]MTH46430.1 GNAT family N-acetyltransferase [Intestinirhabdus alba]